MQLWAEFMAEVREARELAGLSQREVGEHLGVNLRTVSTWELSKRGVHPYDLIRMMMLYGIRLKVERVND